MDKLKSAAVFGDRKQILMDMDCKCSFYFEDENSNRKKLFEQALSHAKHGKVLYILREELMELPQLSQDLTTVNRQYMKMISFLYAKTLDSLIEMISTLPDWQSVPSTIILDNLNEYCNKSHLQNACGVVAMLVDTASSCSKTLNLPCRVLISITKETVGEEYCTTLNDLYCR